MRWPNVARARLALLFRSRAETRMDEEIGFHIEMEADRLVRDEGFDPAEARRRALVSFGGVEKHKEALRDGRGLGWLSGLSLDLKLGARMLIKYPGLTVVSVVGMSVAVAIGAVAFSAIDGIVDARLPFDDGDRIVAIRSQDLLTGDDDRTHLQDLATWRASLSAVEDLSGYRTVERNLITKDRRAESLRIVEMSAAGFRVARVAPLLGRSVHADDERQGAPPVVVIGYDIWQNRFGGSADVVGQTLWLGDVAHTVVGVMPKEFAFPINNRVWTPLRLDPSTFEPGHAPRVWVFGRLAAGASLNDAQNQLTTIGQRLATTSPAVYKNIRARVIPFTRSFVGSTDVVWALHGAQFLVSMLLVVIGTNVAVLVYARTASRGGEIAVRIALGASRGRIVAQLSAEAFILSMLAAAMGLVVADVALRQVNLLLARMGGEQVPFWMHFGITPRVVAYVATLAVLGAVIVGVVPALKATQAAVHAKLQELSSGGAAVRLGRSWTAMIVVQVAVAVVGIPLATMSIKEIRVAVAPRFATTQFLVAHLVFDDVSAPTNEPRSVMRKVATLGATANGSTDVSRELAMRFTSLRTTLIERLSSEPGVRRVVLSSAIPGDESSGRYEVAVDTTAAGLAAPLNTSLRTNSVEPAFFDAFDVPVLMGRRFDVGDAAAADKPVVVNERFVRTYLHGASPLGRRLRYVSPGRGDNVRRMPWQTIVGVVANFPTLADTTVGNEPRIYLPLDANDGRAVVLNVRVASGPPLAVANRLRELTVAVSPSLRLVGVQSLVDRMHDAMAPTRLGLIALVLVVGSVLALSVAGMYALMSLTVTRRRREIGIRSALGAGSSRVVMSILARSAAQIGVGVALGILVLVVILTDQRWILSARDGLDLLGVVGIMSVVGLLAAIGPARRALQIQPTEALKSE